MKFLNHIVNEIKTTKLKMAMVTTPFRLIAATGAKFTQQGTDRVFGRRVLSDEAISNIAGITQKEGETDDDFKLNKARLQFLLTEASTTLTLLMLKVLANALLFPDEDEKEEYKDMDGFYERITNDPDTTIYYALENMLTRFSEDANLVNDPLGMVKMLDLRSIDNTDGLFQAVQQQMYEGNYKSGPNAESNRITTKFGQYFLPKGLLDASLGFGKISKDDYRKKDIINRAYMTDFAKYEAERKNQRNERKTVLRKQLEKQYKNRDKEYIENKLQKRLKAEFPTIKKYFTKKGDLKKGRKQKVKKYD